MQDSKKLFMPNAAMGKVRPFCRSGLEANILRPYCGLLPTRFGHHGCNHYHF